MLVALEEMSPVWGCIELRVLSCRMLTWRQFWLVCLVSAMFVHEVLYLSTPVHACMHVF